MDKVWYASYGSNMLYERFLCYIQGGAFYLKTGEPSKGCKDKTPPIENRPIIIPYKLYFGGRSGSWGNGGVAFLDKSIPSKTIGRAYLVTAEQFEDIKRQEGSWYTEPVDLDTYKGYPVCSFTSPTHREENPPSQEYLKVLKDGVTQMFGEIINISELNLFGL